MLLRFMWEFADGTWVDDEVSADEFMRAREKALAVAELFGTGEIRVISWEG